MPAPHAETTDLHLSSFYRFAGVAAFVAFAANIADVVFGFGDTTIVTYGSKSAVDWFGVFHESGFKGLYQLGILNIVYQLCLIPVYLAFYGIHRKVNAVTAAFALILTLLGTSIYIANSAAIPMFVLAGKYAAATSEAQRAIIAAAGEAALSAGEDFTPGAFVGLFLGGIAAVTISAVMLRGGKFGKRIPWVGIVGFSFLTIFTIWATFIPVGYAINFYTFGLLGGLCALTWFANVSIGLFRIARLERSGA